MDWPARRERSDDRKYVCCSQANLNGHLVITDSSPFAPHPNSFSRFNPLYTGSPFIIRTRCGLLSVLNKLGLNVVYCLCLKKMLEFLPGCLKEKKKKQGKGNRKEITKNPVKYCSENSCIQDPVLLNLASNRAPPLPYGDINLSEQVLSNWFSHCFYICFIWDHTIFIKTAKWQSLPHQGLSLFSFFHFL